MSLEEVVVEVPICVTHRNEKPAIKLRRHINDFELMKIVLSAAFHKKTLIMKPVFTNELISLSSLIEKGILYRKDDKYYYNI